MSRYLLLFVGLVLLLQGPRPEAHVDRTFCGGTTSADDFQLSLLMNKHPEYESLKEQFMQKWSKPEPANGVSVRRIFKVKVRHAFFRY